MLSERTRPTSPHPRHDDAASRDLAAKSKILAVVRAVHRDGMFGSRFPFGYVLHRAVLCIFDADLDQRILNFIDQLPPRFRRILLAARESKGGLDLLWATDPPREYSRDETVWVPDGNPGEMTPAGYEEYGDQWYVGESRAIRMEALR